MARCMAEQRKLEAAKRIMGCQRPVSQGSKMLELAPAAAGRRQGVATVGCGNKRSWLLSVVSVGGILYGMVCGIRRSRLTTSPLSRFLCQTHNVVLCCVVVCTPKLPLLLW